MEHSHAHALPLFEASVARRKSRRDPIDPAVTRLKERLQELGISQTELCLRLNADGLGKRWRLSRLSKRLNGRLPLYIRELREIATAAGLSLVDIVRTEGVEFVGEMTPTQLKVLHLMQENPVLAEHIVALLPDRRRGYNAQLRARQASLRAKIRTPDPD